MGEAQLTGQAKFPPAEWPNYLQKGFNMCMLPESNPQQCFCAGTFHASTGGPQEPDKTMSVPVLCRLEFEPNRRMNRITVRSNYGEVAQAVCKIIESYFMVPQRS